MIYVGHTEDLRQERLPFRHPRSPCWVKRAGSKWRLHVAWFEVPGGQAGHRKQIAEELCAVYQPRLQRAAVRPHLEGRVDRRLLRADHRPAHHGRQPPTLSGSMAGDRRDRWDQTRSRRPNLRFVTIGE